MTVTEMDVETARRVLAEHREQEEQRKAAEAQVYVGRFFKYQNSYGADREKWWLYAAVTGVGDFGWLKGWSFQHATDGLISINLDEHISTIVHGGDEIASDEFWEAAKAIKATVVGRLTR